MIALGPFRGSKTNWGIPWHWHTLTLFFSDLKDVKDGFQWFLVPRHIIFPGEKKCLLRSNRPCFIGSAHLLFPWASSHQTPVVSLSGRRKNPQKISKNQFLRHMKLGYPDMFRIKPDNLMASHYEIGRFLHLCPPWPRLVVQKIARVISWWFRFSTLKICRKNMVQMSYEERP